MAGFEWTGSGIAVYPSRKRLLKHVAWDAFSVTTPLIFAYLLAYVYLEFIEGPDWGVWIFLPLFFLWALVNVRHTLYGVWGDFGGGGWGDSGGGWGGGGFGDGGGGGGGDGGGGG